MPFTTLCKIHDALLEKDVRPSITCLWTIENFSYFLQNNKKDHLRTPPWDSRLFMNLILYPQDEYLSKYISIFFQMSRDCGKCDLELSLIAADGSCLHKYEEQCYKTSGRHGERDFIAREEVFKNRDVYLPQDTLTVCCRLYINPDNCKLTEKCYFTQTRIVVDRRTFLWNIPVINYFRKSQEDNVFMGNIVFALKFCFIVGTMAESKVIIEIHPHFTQNCFLTCKMDVMDAEGTVPISLLGEHRFEEESIQQVWNFPTFVTENKLLSEIYLKDEKLSIRCEFAVSFGEVSIEFNEIHTLPCSSSSKRESLEDDILDMYKDQKFTDATLCTKVKSFPVHRVILSARSPVFSRMFEAAFEEGKTGVVEIPDVDADTMGRMLQFIYTDNMEDLSFEDASSLYSAADKYDVHVLSKKCSSILKSKLSISNVCEALLIAELHQGQGNLRKVVQDFILAHDEEVLKSEEWVTLEESHPQVTAKVLRQVYLQKLTYTK